MSATIPIRAAVLRAADAPLRIERLRLPAPGPEQVLIRVAGTGLCHTDLLPRSGGPWGRPPVILGHESAGIVEAVGERVERVKPGDAVIASFASCGRCGHCQTGRPPYCEHFWTLNFTGAPEGAELAVDSAGKPVSSRWFGQSSLATHAVIDVASVVPVRHTLPLEKLAPLGCGILTGAAAVLCGLAVPPGARLAVLGTGSVGLAAVAAARLAGATEVTAVDQHDARLDLAAEFGANHLLRSGEPGELGARLRGAVPRGFDYLVDTTGLPAVVSSGIEVLTATGVAGLLGAPKGPLQLDRTALASGRTVRGMLFGDADPQVWIPRLIRYWNEGLFPFDRIVTTYPLDEVDRAERDTVRGAVIKPVLVPETAR
ncbi:NAD(P)-dependent alcohol dehydrogenase [Sciscionella marina]|uniref:NAD(P)-dependent alcohol dehydrogenase n=1 Tax=Sciscionella marina TaxID=508770 RepID=UPI0003777C53|nr:NAD(P)-dependent alcohol dehydrogenase [Sciscionella marina]